MGRKRKNGPEWLHQLKRCYIGKYKYEYRPKAGGCIKLCPLDAPRRVVEARYYEELHKTTDPSGTFAELVRDYFASRWFKKLASRTRRDYEGYALRVLPVFGKLNYKRIQPGHIRDYMDRRGKTSEVQANRHHSFMSAVFAFAYQYSSKYKIKVNPCHGVKKFPEPPRTRYIEDWEYTAVLKEAEAWPLLWGAMEVSYRCGSRQADVWNLSPQKLVEKGIDIKQGKTDKRQIKEWNPKLRTAIDLVLNQQTARNLNYVFCNKNGHHPAQGTLRSWFSKARKLAEAKHPGACFDFTFHDIKAKAISDYAGKDKKVFSGHLTDAQVEVYDRKVKISPTLD